MTSHLLRVALLLCAALLVPQVAQAARAKQVRYAGIHSVPKGKGGGLCHIEAPHVHVYAPDVQLQYREHEGQQVFVGDPVAYGWDGERHAYYGHHPIQVNVLVGDSVPDEEFCYLDGPHYHAFVPPPEVTADFKVEGDAYFYVGTPPPIYVEARPAMIKINAIYEPIVYERPVITVTPPNMWIGVRFPARAVRSAVAAPPPPPRGGGGGAAVIGVDVHVPVIEVRPPSVQIGIGVGVGVGVGGGGHVHKHKHKKHKKHRGRW